MGIDKFDKSGDQNGCDNLPGEVRSSRKADDLVDFMVDVVWDNLNIHHDGSCKRWTEFNARHGERFHFHWTPIHASWVNQVELFFGILHARVLRHGVFDDVEDLEDAVIDYINHWNGEEAARLTHLGGGQWGLSLPRHTGRWEKTPFTGTMDDLVETLVSNFGFYLEELSAKGDGNS